MKQTPIGLGVVGLGRAFTLMLPTFLADERIRLVAATDTRQQACDQFAHDFAAPAYERIKQLCADPQVEAVYIASPHQLHAQHIAIAAAAGKAILVEKPLAISMAECNHIVALIESANVPLIVGHSHSFNGPVQHAAHLLNSGRFGPVRMLTALNYTDFLFRPRRPEELDTAQGGGVVFSQAAHQIDVARILLGGLVDTIYAQTGQWDNSRPCEGAYSALLRFENGAFASLVYSGYAHYDSDEQMDGISEMGWPKQTGGYHQSRARLAIRKNEAALKASTTYGGEAYKTPSMQTTAYHQHFGPVIISAQHADLRLTPAGLMIYSDEDSHFEPTPPNRIPRVEVIDELWAAVRMQQPPIHDARWARATTEACIALLQSAAAGQPIHLHQQVAAK